MGQKDGFGVQISNQVIEEGLYASGLKVGEHKLFG